jgi:hypothetical protein
VRFTALRTDLFGHSPSRTLVEVGHRYAVTIIAKPTGHCGSYTAAGPRHQH